MSLSTVKRHTSKNCAGKLCHKKAIVIHIDPELLIMDYIL